MLFWTNTYESSARGSLRPSYRPGHQNLGTHFISRPAVCLIRLHFGVPESVETLRWHFQFFRRQNGPMYRPLYRLHQCLSQCNTFQETV
jgi:hypothetical protein